MKRVYVVILTIIIAISCIGCSASTSGNRESDNANTQEAKNTSVERFSVRNGIMFGMTQDEVKEIEGNNGLDGDGQSYKNVNIAGFDGGEITYSYHDSTFEALLNEMEGIDSGEIDTKDDGKLEAIEYAWDESWHLSPDYHSTFDKKDVEKITNKQKEIYEALEETLSKKYNIIGSIENDKLSYIPFEDIDISPFKFEDTNAYKYYKYGFTQYLAEDGDNYVVIICKFYRNDAIRDMGLFSNDPETIRINVKVEYRAISKEEIEEMVDGAKDIQEQKDSDL